MARQQLLGMQQGRQPPSLLLWHRLPEFQAGEDVAQEVGGHGPPQERRQLLEQSRFRYLALRHPRVGIVAGDVAAQLAGKLAVGHPGVHLVDLVPEDHCPSRLRAAHLYETRQGGDDVAEEQHADQHHDQCHCPLQGGHRMDIPIASGGHGGHGEEDRGKVDVHRRSIHCQVLPAYISEPTVLQTLRLRCEQPNHAQQVCQHQAKEYDVGSVEELQGELPAEDAPAQIAHKISNELRLHEEGQSDQSQAAHC
mmetsp:Transcript_13941/g.42064  ORF Transcript_13941/g.42064 Transcript_13941/m.42064 type:complete len:252 (-) Transcript_13941:864-1619(-)